MTKPLLGIFLLFSLLSAAQSQASNTLDRQVQAQETVVLLHGLGRSNLAMWRLADRLEDADYHVVRIGYRSIGTTLSEVIADISRQINHCCLEAEHPVHFAGHSLGGLLIRAYLQHNQPKSLGNVVLIGTPNQGTSMANWLGGKEWVQFVMPMARELGTEPSSFPNSLAPPYYPVGVIAGVADYDNDDYLPGRDDGMVTVESTKLEGMRDFVEVNTGHSMMRYNDAVATQTIYFLKHGHFSKAQ